MQGKCTKHKQTGLFAILRFLVWNGLLAATAGAPEGTLEKLQVLGFDPERPEFQDCKECSVCLVSFDASEEIRVTGCGHAFHARCLGPWLRTRRTCLDRRFTARKREVKPLRASQSLSETFPCTGSKAFSLQGKALRGNRATRIRV